jgi:uncharacterized membrane protein YhaH (DUF805 family)
MSEERIPKRVKIDEKWYRAGKEADGTFSFKDDSNYHGSTTKVEYTAKKPNPVLHPNFFHIFNTNGSQVGEFWTEPKSYSGCISDLETEEGSSSYSSDDEPTPSYSQSVVGRALGEDGGPSFWTIVALFFLAFWSYIKGPFVALSSIGETAYRKEWWGTVVRTTLLSFLFILIFVGIFADKNEVVFLVIFMILFLGFFMLPIIVVSIRRARDAGMQWWLALIPGVNIIVCGFFPSK